MHDTRATQPLLAALQDALAVVRMSVAQALGEIGDPQAGPVLRAAANDPSPEVRTAAAEALLKLGARPLPAIGSTRAQGGE